MAARIIWDGTDATTSPLSGENPLVFMTGPLTGTRVPTNGRYTVAALSPLTGIWGEAHAGGSWGYALKRAGFDGIVLQGKANTPVYVWIEDNRVCIRDAHHLWGKDTFELEGLLRSETDARASVVTIGRAGERLVKFAAVMSDGPFANAAARCGMGAVMGYKKLKAIAVSGTKKPQVHDEEKLALSIREHFPETARPQRSRRETEFENIRLTIEETAAIKNWQLGHFEDIGDKLAEVTTREAKPRPCHVCPVGCYMLATVDGQKHVPGEFLIPAGSNCLIDDMEALNRAYEMCNRYGLDAISTGHVIAMAMELYEKGLITTADTDGIELRWGSAPAFIELVRKIGERQGCGELLAEGVRGISERLGGRASEWAVHVKGLEPSRWDPRAKNTWALQNATGNRGADHLDGFMALRHQDYAQFMADSPEVQQAFQNPLAIKGVARLVIWAQDSDCLVDSLPLCKFLNLPRIWMREVVKGPAVIMPPQILDWLNLVTGWDVTLEEFLKTAERIFNLKRLINVRRGVIRKDDMLPLRLLHQKRGGDGLAAENLPPLETMLDEYYSRRGWSETGIPTREKLAELGLPSLQSG